MKFTIFLMANWQKLRFSPRPIDAIHNFFPWSFDKFCDFIPEFFDEICNFIPTSFGKMHEYWRNLWFFFTQLIDEMNDFLMSNWWNFQFYPASDWQNSLINSLIINSKFSNFFLWPIDKILSFLWNLLIKFASFVYCLTKVASFC